MLNLAEALEVLNSTKDSEITIGYLEELAKNVSIEDAKANSNAITYLYSGGHMDNNGKWVSVRDTYITSINQISDNIYYISDFGFCQVVWKIF